MKKLIATIHLWLQEDLKKGETMNRILLTILIAVSLGIWSMLLQGQAQVPVPLSEEELARRADVMRRHEKELRQNPDVLGLLPTEDRITIVTDRPQGMPKEIEGVPVTTIPPPPTLSPPPGAIVLKPNGVREELKAGQPCPEGVQGRDKISLAILREPGSTPTDSQCDHDSTNRWSSR
ncbi:MAG: hypothetical protein FJ147_23280 [Deltaproteobacteria bacterium]|nr:hypothetical protein [Deltaproteobacteria bacterium]